MKILETEIPGWECHIIETVDDLPELPDCKAFFMDFECTLYDIERLAVCHLKNSLGSFFPYSGDRISGIAVVYGKEKIGYYIPIRHKIGDKLNPANLPLEPVQKWLKRHNQIGIWCNANPKFDAHFAKADGFDFRGTLVDCLVDAKLYDVEYPTHALKPLCRNWVEMPMGDVDKVKTFLKEAKTGDYGQLPIDLCAQYAVLDCFGARALQQWLIRHQREGMENIVKTEHELTGVLYDMESVGMKADRKAILLELRSCLRSMIFTSTRLYELTDEEFVDSSTHIHNLLCTQLGLPILAWTTKKDKATGKKTRGGPSFDKDALLLYLDHPQVKINPNTKEIVECIQKFRDEANFKTLFLETYLRFMDDEGKLHSNYNQIVRTGRMSCRHPNAQQLNKRAKKLIIPEEGMGFLSFDASQMEFRIIIHYIRDPDALEAYAKDPNTDFHVLVAESVAFDFEGRHYEASRKQGKTLNFAMAFGAGKKKVTAQLAGDDALIQLVSEVADEWILAGKLTSDEREEFTIKKCYEIASKVWITYHEQFPGLQATSKSAAESTRFKGYAINLFGRRRYLKKRRSNLAFNTAVQGSAMDYIKDRMVVLAPRNNKFLRDKGVVLLMNVHDELVFYGPLKWIRNPLVVSYIRMVLQTSPIKLRVPILWDGGFSFTNWAEAAGDDQVFDSEGAWVSGRIPKDYYLTDAEVVRQVADTVGVA